MWQRRDPARVYLFSDIQARTVGDLLTIIVEEGTTVNNSEQRQLQKETDARSFFDFDSSTGGDLGSHASSASMDAALTSKREFKGNTRFNSARAFLDQVTVQVIDILPNGNLIIAGKRRVIVSGEAKTLIVSGVVRMVDVRPDNTIESQYIANLDMSYEGVGVEPRFINQGWLGKIGNHIWPF